MSPPPPLLAASVFETPKSSTLIARAAADGAREEEVLRLEIAVHDARGVRLGDRLAGLHDVLRRDLDA